MDCVVRFVGTTDEIIHVEDGRVKMCDLLDGDWIKMVYQDFRLYWSILNT
jgi:hypothetical protein